MRTLSSGIAVSVLCVIHVFFPNIERSLRRYKHIWIQVTGGMAIGYVFMYMLPKLSNDTSLIISNDPAGWEFQLLYKWHANYYKLTLKWLMVISLIAGWLAGLTIQLPETIKASSSAFIAGGVLINAITEKLPDRKEGHVWPFIAGIGFFVVLAAIMRSIPR